MADTARALVMYVARTRAKTTVILPLTAGGGLAPGTDAML
jgi:hypothetical protein